MQQTNRTPTTAGYAFSYVKQFGMHLVPLPPRQKRPLTEDWGNNLLTSPEEARDYFTANPDANIGVALGPSRVCSFDVDDIEATRLIFEEFGWDLDELRDNYPTIQGAPGGFRVMFRVPDGVKLPYHSLTWPKHDGSRGRFTVWEIRSADDAQQRQDVLPPSIHPDTGKEYTWITRPIGSQGLPHPPEFLLQLWRNWEALKPQFQSVCPWAEKPQQHQNRKKPARNADSGGKVIEAYTEATPVEHALAQYGYRQQGKRWLSPHSKTGLAGVVVIDGKAFIHHASDPLCTDESGSPVDAFDLFAEYEHGGDKAKAMKAAAKLLGMAYSQQAKPVAPVQNHIDPETGEILPHAAANDNASAPLDIFAECPAPDLMRGMLPKAIEDYAFDCGELLGASPAMIAIPALVACAAALHDEVKLQPKRHEDDWLESARLWCAIVGDPSVRKSPSISRATKRLRKIDIDLHEVNSSRMADYAGQMEQYKEAKKELKKQGGGFIPAPEAPKIERMVVEDVTVEALSEVLKDNSRGVLCVQDELSGWFGSMDAYNGGKAGNKDRAYWLQAYNGGGRVVDRVMRGSIKIPNWSVSMIGGIQPDAIRRISANMTDDGLMQRFMIIIGRNAAEYDRPKDGEAYHRYSDLVDSLFKIQGSGKPVTLTEDAHRVRESLSAYAEEMAKYPALPGGLRSHLGKWSGLFSRLLLIFHAIECVADYVHPTARQVSGETASKVDRLMRKFLLPHALSYYTDVLGDSSDLEHARWIAGHILSKRLNSITNRDILQAYKQWRGLDEWRRQRIMQMLEDMGWVAPLISEDSRPTRRGATSWIVPPAVHATYAEKAASEASRREKLRAEIAAMHAR